MYYLVIAYGAHINAFCLEPTQEGQAVSEVRFVVSGLGGDGHHTTCTRNVLWMSRCLHVSILLRCGSYVDLICFAIWE